jgi:hypothetical protein
MRYWSRASVPVSWRTMNGTVLPWSVVVFATSLGGAAGLYARSSPPEVDL